MSEAFTVIAADVIVVTTRIVTIRISDGPAEGKEFLVPRTCFEDPALVDKDDDECVIASWWLEKNGLLVQ